MTTATTGTGTITLGSAVTNYQTFAAAGVTNGNTVSYVIEDGANWEVGTGVYTSSGTTLSRTVIQSTSSGSPITLSGTAVVYVSALASDIVPASGGTFSGDTTFSKAIIESVYAISGTTPAINPSNGMIQTWTLSANSTPTDSVLAGESVTLMIDDGTAYTITWPSVTWKTDAGVSPTLNTTGYTVVVLWKVGSTLYGARVGNA
jgi:hypothetical protein